MNDFNSSFGEDGEAAPANMDIRVRPAYLDPHSSSHSSSPTNGRPASRPTTADEPIIPSTNRWVSWREEIKKVGKETKKTKIPYDPKTGQTAEIDNPATWATSDEAERWTKQRGDMASGSCSANSARARSAASTSTLAEAETADFAPWSPEVIDPFATYTEISPSGTGAKLFFRRRQR